MSTSAPESRERLSLEDFESTGDEFSAVNWLNARLARNAVTFDKLDQHLNAMSMSCQLLCMDTSESIEVSANQLVTQLPSTMRDLERMHQDVLTGRDRLSTVVESLKDVDGSKRSSLHGLADIDALKTRVETASSALREVGSWERKIRDCEQMVNSGNLPAALRQLSSLKEVLAAFRMLPEYPKKEEQLRLVEESLLSTTRRRAKLGIERNAVADLQACCEVFIGLQKGDELGIMVNTVLLDMAEKAWQSRGGASVSDLGGAVKSVLETLAQAVAERWALLRVIDKELAAQQAPASDDAAAAEVAANTEGISNAILAVINFLGEQLEVRFSGAQQAPSANLAEAGVSGKEATMHLRAAQAVGLLAAYVDGFQALQKCAPPGEGTTLWPEVCRGSQGFNTVPWGLLKEVAVYVVWQPMQDDATALLPPTGPDIRAAEAVLAAESNAKRLLELPVGWARRLEDQGAAQFAVVWLACVDATCARYWRSWSKLLGMFQNTLEAQLPQEGEPTPTECHHDATLLSEAMQLHRMLHESLPARFAAFQAEVLEIAARLRASVDAAFGAVVKTKLTDLSTWCERIGVPSADALRTAHGALEGTSPDLAVLAARATQALPTSTAALANAEKEVRAAVVRICVQPVQVVMATYAESQEWSKSGDLSDTILGGSLPLKCMTAVGEHLLALLPQLETQDTASLQWLPTILEAVVEIAAQKVMLIKRLSANGAQQLAVDMEYLQKVADALGSDDAAAGNDSKAARELAKLRETLVFLVGQQRRQQECTSKGETFVEERMQLPTRFERPLRVALGLERT